MAPTSDYPAIYLSYFVYALAIWFYARWLRRQLNPAAQRLGWFLFAAQLVLLTLHGWPIGPPSWWEPNYENNVPVYFAIFQALAGSLCGFALLFLSSQRPRWLNVFWGLISLGLFILAQDELGVIHERFLFLEEIYLAGGALLVVFSALLWLRLDAPKRRYLYLLIVGLGVGVIGARIVDRTPLVCLDGGQIFSAGCLRLIPFEESLENLGVSFVLLAMLGMAEHTIPLERWRRSRRYLLLIFGLVVIISFRQNMHLQARLDWHDRANHHDTEFANHYRLRGSVFPTWKPILNGHYYLLEFYGGVGGPLANDFGYAIQIVDQENGTVYAAHHRWSQRAAGDWLRGRMYKEYQQLWVPEEVPLRRALWFLFSIWQQTEAGSFAIIPIRVSADHQLSDTQVVVHEFVVPAEGEVSLPADAAVFRFENGFVLVSAELPEVARPGEILAAPMVWQTDADGDEDWVQFLHFVHEESGALWNHDQQPLGARLPTRLWYEGLRDTEAWQIALPADLAPGRYAIYTGLYRLSDGARLPANDVDGTPLPDARVPLGYITIGE